MGIERENLVIYGVKSDDEHCFVSSDIYDPEFDEKVTHVLDVDNLSDCRLGYNFREEQKFVALVEPYAGEFSLFGLVVAASGQDRWGEMVDLNVALSFEDMQALDLAFRKKCEEVGVDVGNFTPGLHVITYTT